MKITTLSYRRAANLGEYESVHIEIAAEFGEGDKKAEVFSELKKFVDKALAYEVEEHKKIKRNDKGARI